MKSKVWTMLALVLGIGFLQSEARAEKKMVSLLTGMPLDVKDADYTVQMSISIGPLAGSTVKPEALLIDGTDVVKNVSYRSRAAAVYEEPTDNYRILVKMRLHGRPGIYACAKDVYYNRGQRGGVTGVASWDRLGALCSLD